MNPSRILRGGDHAPAIVSHRGLWSAAPENSLAAINAAFDAGANIIEIDVRRCKDGAFVIIHDETLDRTTDQSGAVADWSLRQLGLAHLKTGAGGVDATITEHTVTTLDQALSAVRGRGMVNLDVKDRADLADVARFVGAMDMSLSVILKAEVRDTEEAALLSEAIGDSAVFMPMLSTSQSRWLPAMIHDLRPMAFPCYELHCLSLEELKDAVVMARAQRAGVWVNTLSVCHLPGYTDEAALTDPKAIWGALIETGVSIIQTDEVAALDAYREAIRHAA